MLDNLPSNDAHIVKKLKDAGLIIVGKANLSEWANFRGNPQQVDGQVMEDKQIIPITLSTIHVVQALEVQLQ
ncbi:MAG: hypothetical protein CM15mP12_0220 [Gammaproteobacteria bacterium]|nr:MAG: hypothetical protein CM15mP12_0220 [Gammaproteobacteria bacterium]